MINAYLTDTIHIKRTTRDEYGTPTEKTVAMRGRLEQKTRLVKNQQGEQVASSARLLLPVKDSNFLNHDDRIQFGGRTYAILHIDRVKAFSEGFLRVDLG